VTLFHRRFGSTLAPKSKGRLSPIEAASAVVDGPKVGEIRMINMHGA
jgi:hypothetical protein